ncbi:barstar family protein [Dactylosporangium sp. NPDC049742]|uniref:barstar family protein n=1 Tax=Dactylosporangium sp. NPDC049742 TaxID=3154737 RepID=UPI003432360E
MVTPTLTERLPPWVVVTTADDPWVSDEIATLRRLGGGVVRLDGRALQDPRSLFVEFARVLGFPGYFGHNWHALVDCIADWHGHGMPSRDVAVLIDAADELADADFLRSFMWALCEGAWNANLQLDADGVPHGDYRPPFTLHFVLLLDQTAPAAFAEPVAKDPYVTVAAAGERLTVTLADPL